MTSGGNSWIRKLRIAHRQRVLRGAAAAVKSPWRFVARELMFLPLRPLVMLVRWVANTNPSTSWNRVTSLFGGQIADFYLKVSGRRIYIRSGTADVFTLYETHSKKIYEPPIDVKRTLARIDTPLRILDLGGNIGLFALEAIRMWPDSSVVSFEPDPENFSLLNKNYEANPGVKWQIINAAAAVKDGRMPFVTGYFAASRMPSGGDEKATQVAMVDIFPYLETCDLLKIDIEGGEWAILQDNRLNTLKATAVVLEYHPWGCPFKNPEKAAREAFERIGFRVGPAEELEEEAGTFWAWR